MTDAKQQVDVYQDVHSVT